VIRQNTERKEAINNEHSTLIGDSESSMYKGITDEIKIKNRFSGKSNNPFGDGKASKRIFEIIERLV
jgi:UDP-N-acetylglucosamine 2-epimerase (non-hydrolysing)